MDAPENARPIPLPELDRAEWFDVEVPADLERSREWERGENGMLVTWRVISTGCGKPGRMHPKSYGAEWARKESAFNRRVAEYERERFGTAPAPVCEEGYGADLSGVSKGKPHAQSYRPDLPLAGFTDAQLVKPTKDDLAAWLARPLTYAFRAPVERETPESQYLAVAPDRLPTMAVA